MSDTHTLLEAARFWGDCYAAVNHEPTLAWAVVEEHLALGNVDLLKHLDTVLIT